MAYMRRNRFSQLVDCKIYCWSKSIKLVFPSAVIWRWHEFIQRLSRHSYSLPTALVHMVYLKDFWMGHSKILYLYLGNPIPTEVKRSMSILGAPFLWGGFGKGPSWVGLGFQLLVYVTDVVKFCAFVWHYL